MKKLKKNEITVLHYEGEFVLSEDGTLCVVSRDCSVTSTSIAIIPFGMNYGFWELIENITPVTETDNPEYFL